jgi:TolB protein
MVMFSLILVFSSLNIAVGQEEIQVRIGSSGKGEVKLGVEPFRIKTESDEIEQYRKIAYSILLHDLGFSLRFDVVELDEQLRVKTNPDPKKIHEEFSKAWLGSGVDVFVRGEISKVGQEYEINFSLEGPTSEKPILKKTYRARRSEFRKVIHMISDDIIFAMTGEHGINQTKIVFISKRTGNKEMFIADCDGFNEKKLTQNRSINLSPSWSPFGDEIIFTSFREGNPDLYIYNMNNNSTRKYISYPGINSAAAWSPDGKRVAVTLSKDGNPELYVVEFFTGKIRRLTHNRGIDTSPAWSPTGKEIAFTSDRAGTPAIYVMGSDGSNVRRLTFLGNYNASPAWSPLGDRIAFVGRSIDEGNTDLYVIEITGENLMRISAIGDNIDPDWSPDGYHVAFASNRDGSYDIYTITWDGAELKRITYSGQNYSPAWSPVMIR